ncbi:unannotated protein [freshwater metagenome]|uniref:Unannotated protein n=1 Tax=freshwater metagenome TaxID=449393 RepID=A0A6J6YX30_9ZZZZ
MVQAAQHLGVRAEIEARQIEEGQPVAVTDVEEQVRGAAVVPVLEKVGQREAEHVLVETDGPLHVGAEERHVMHATGGAGPAFGLRAEVGGAERFPFSGAIHDLTLGTEKANCHP